MKTTEQVMKELAFTDEILDIVNNRDEFTQSDLQGAVQALVMKIMASK